MKKAVLIVLLAMAITFSFSFLGTGTVAYAETLPLENGTYNAKSDITVYATISRKDTALFIIPETYYFDIIGHDETVFYINYNGSVASDGYFIIASDLPTDKPMTLSDKDKNVTDANKALSFELTLTADTTFTQRTGAMLNDREVAVSDATSIKFIGFKDAERTAAYVLLNNEDYGYIPTANLKIKDTDTMLAGYTIDFHPNYRTIVSEEPTGETEEPSNAKLIRIVLIVGIVVPALVIMFLLFKPSKKNRYDSDRNRGYNMGNSPYDRPRSRYRDDYDDYDRGPAPRGGRRDDYDDDYYYRGDRRY